MLGPCSICGVRYGWWLIDRVGSVRAECALLIIGDAVGVPGGRAASSSVSGSAGG
jgi:hypothetical protein